MNWGATVSVIPSGFISKISVGITHLVTALYRSAKSRRDDRYCSRPIYWADDWDDRYNMRYLYQFRKNILLVKRYTEIQ